jgi:hypothetical protein
LVSKGKTGNIKGILDAGQNKVEGSFKFTDEFNIEFVPKA